MRVAAYIRVSKERDGMISPDLYRRQVLAWAEFKGIQSDHIEFFEDIDYSGRLAAEDRPAFSDMLARRAEFDIVVVPRLDRFGRSLQAALESFKLLADSGTDFAALDIAGLDTTSSSGQLVLHIFLALAEFESNRIGDGWRATHARRRSQGKHHAGGTIPFGYRYDREADGGLRVEKNEAKKVRDLFERYVKGESQASIARALGFTTNTTVSRMLQRPAYAGLMPDGSLGAWEPLVSEEVFEQAQARRKANGSSKAGRPQGSGTKLLTGLLYCGRCGAPCHAGGPKGYRCTKADECGLWHVDGARADQAVIDEFGERGLDHLRRLAEERKNGRKASPVGAIDKKIAGVDQKIARLVRRAAETDSEAFIAAFDKEASRLEAKRQALDTERARIKVSETDEGLSILMIADDETLKPLQEYLIGIGRLPSDYERPTDASNIVRVGPGEVPFAEAWLVASRPERQRLLAAAIEKVITVEKPGSPRGVKVLWRAA